MHVFAQLRSSILEFKFAALEHSRFQHVFLVALVYEENTLCWSALVFESDRKHLRKRGVVVCQIDHLDEATRIGVIGRIMEIKRINYSRSVWF